MISGQRPNIDLETYSVERFMKTDRFSARPKGMGWARCAALIAATRALKPQITAIENALQLLQACRAKDH